MRSKLIKLAAIAIVIAVAAVASYRERLEQLYWLNVDSKHYWSQYGGSAKRQNHSAFAGPERCNLLWVREPARELFDNECLWNVDTAPVIGSQGNLCFIEKQRRVQAGCEGSLYNTLISLSHDGRELWRSKPLEAYSWDWLGIAPNGNIYHASLGCLSSFSSNGELQWTYKSRPTGDGLVVSGSGHIYVGAVSDREVTHGYFGPCDRLVRLSGNGRVEKKVTTELWRALNAPAIDSIGRVILVQKPFKLVIVNPRTSEVESDRLHSASPGFPASCPVVADDDSIWLAFDHGIILHASKDGRLLGLVQLPVLAECHSVCSTGAARGAILTRAITSILDEDRVLVSTGSGSWIIDSNYDVFRFPQSEPEKGRAGGGALVDSSGNVYLCSGQELVALSPTGEELWRYDTQFDESFDSQPVIGSNGVLYVLSDVSRLYAFGQ